MVSRNTLSVRPSRSARRLLLAAVVAPLALSATASSASAAVSIHVLSDWINVWVTLGNPHYTNVSTLGDAAHVSNSQGALSGMDMLSIDLPDYQGLPTAPLAGAEVDMFMSSVDVGPGFGNPTTEAAFWGIWVTGRSWGIHIIYDPSATMALTGVDTDGTYNYSSLPGQVFPMSVEYTDPSGVVTNQIRPVAQLEFNAPAPLPAPGAVALLGLGGMVAIRRRR